MRTYQELLQVGESDLARGGFCVSAINEFMGTSEYASAVAGEAYYGKHNLTIEKFQKMLYTLSGREVPDIWSANYKLKTLFFRRLISQQVQYVLGNGMTLSNPKNKEKLGKDFDFALMTAAKHALASGVSFGFWNVDHLEIFSYADTPSQPGFMPLYDENTAELRGGIRYWFKYVGDDRIGRYTLYEPDGFTEYIKTGNEDAQVLEEKRAYKLVRKVLQDGVIEDEVGENYSSLPIVPLYANDLHESELVGIRECIDCYDYIKSGLANDIDDTSGFYWILKNTGGMDDVDLAEFIKRMKTVRASVVDGDDGATAEAHTLDVPCEARKTMLELLRKDIYEDFQALDVNTLSASAKTTQEIKAAYQAQDNKCADFEYFIIKFCYRILELAGIDDDPTFRWNRTLNETEQTNMVLTAANYLTDEAIIKHLPFLTPEEADEIIKTRNAESFNRFEEDEDEGEQGEE